MSKQTSQHLIDQLDSLLEHERKALVSGDLAQLTEIVPRKEVLIDNLNALDQLERSVLEQTQTKLERNQLLLNSALAGIQAVAGRMAELRKAREGLDVYDETGRKTRYGMMATAKLEKRA
ncbi:flagellar export chaperone FlgN [Aliisedimentitalea scapharcae]|uniref:Flagellar export chaperone FlgN n=1 Tax=Aliisedimentitalea scapharcae TaxID=1524259 RepID=A0ABZ2XWD3_9RHOB|nr:flagellar protein FlgN [Rhodobacteraceae bacterium M382]